MRVSRGTPEEGGVAGHGVDQLLRVALLLEQLERLARVAGAEVGIALVVEVVEQAGGGPQLLVLAPLAGVGDACAASTPSRCLRSDSTRIHSVNELQASSRVGGPSRRQGIQRGDPNSQQMAFGTLAPPARALLRTDPAWRSSSSRAARPSPGRVVPAGNKNAALPALAASLLTSEEVVLRNIPRIRDVEAMLELLVQARREGRVARRERGRAPRRRGQPHRRSTRACAERIRASFLLAGPAAGALRPRRHAAARRRRDRPPPARSAPRRLPRARRRGRTSTASLRARRAPGGLHACDFFMDEPSVMATENALMAAALTPGLDGDPQRRVRAARAGPRAPADADGRADRGHRLEPDDRARPGGARRRRLRDRARLHRDRQLHRARGLHRRRAAHQGRACPTTCA